MFHEFYQHLPQLISPIAFSIGSFSVRWYSIAYILGFGVVYLILLWRVNNDDIKKIIKISDFQISNLILDFLLVGFFSSLIGGRIGYVLIYNFPYYWQHPREIILPFASNGEYIGLFGMSYHGALLGVLLGSLIFLKIKKINFFAWADFVVPAVPLGYFFGRIGNFFNGELYGRITNSAAGMYFANDQAHLRFPSQLFEAFLEGILLFILLWRLRKKNIGSGFLFTCYLIFYSLLRFCGEFFREPDPQLGYFLGWITLGQLLSFLMLVSGIIVLFKIKKNNRF